MTAWQFEALARLIYGDRWQQPTATLLGVSVRNVQFWAAEPPARFKPVPPGVEAELMREARGRWGDDETAPEMARRAARAEEITIYYSRLIWAWP